MEIFGGDIFRNKAFKNILSIGFEIETSQLVKFTNINNDFETEEPIDMLLNSDSAQKDISAIMNEDVDEDEMIENLEDKEYVYRHTELLILDVGKGKDVSFHITNDMTESQFVKQIQKVCEDTGTTDEEIMENKNKLFKFKVDNGIDYDINFLQGVENKNCATFSDVEWVATHYKPKLHSNVILEAFTNTIKILLKHLHGLERQHGKLIMVDKESENNELIIDDYDLYHMPNSNLYYLQTNTGGIESINLTIQMTFSAHVSNIYFIMKQLTEDNLNLYKDLTKLSKERLTDLTNIELCVDALITEYNKNEENYKIISNTPIVLREIKNYIALILYKTHIYLNVYLQSTGEEAYFKNSLYLNVRHSNYVLYSELKKCLIKLFSDKLSGKNETEQNTIVVNIIKKICIQEDILFKHFLKDQKFIRKNAFRISNTLDISNKNYGDPKYSLVSYFDFFENPIKPEDDDISIKNDWLEYKSIDANSTRMDIKNDIVLIEFRSFPKLLKNYITKVLDAKSNKDLEINKRGFGVVTIGIIEKFIEKYDLEHNIKPTDYNEPITPFKPKLSKKELIKEEEDEEEEDEEEEGEEDEEEGAEEPEEGAEEPEEGAEEPEEGAEEPEEGAEEEHILKEETPEEFEQELKEEKIQNLKKQKSVKIKKNVLKQIIKTKTRKFNKNDMKKQMEKEMKANKTQRSRRSARSSRSARSRRSKSSRSRKNDKINK